MEQKILDQLNMKFPNSMFSVIKDSDNVTTIAFDALANEFTEKKIRKFVEKIMTTTYDFMQVRPYHVERMPF